MTTITSFEMQMLQTLRAKADELARLMQEANTAGFNINFNLNAALGACDKFDVCRLVPVDLKMGAN